jgi:uncharacterized membrane protein YphA (DoxX/SURF4 family)
MAVVFGVASINKFTGGLDEIVTVFQQVFAGSWLPAPMVVFAASTIPFVEALLALWLLSGFRLKTAWIVSAIQMIVLIFGISVARKYSVAADNTVYLLMIIAGLYFADLKERTLAASQAAPSSGPSA